MARMQARGGDRTHLATLAQSAQSTISAARAEKSSGKTAAPPSQPPPVPRSPRPRIDTMRIASLLLACAATCLTAFAADGPDGGGVRSHIQPVGEIAAAGRDKAWAGLVTSRAPAVLRDQLHLGRGAGLVVDSVAAGSVAERAGVVRHDVLVSVDGQLLLLPEQLVALLEAATADAPLECTLIRAGVERKVSFRNQPVEAEAPPHGLRPAQSVLSLIAPRRSPAVATVMQLPDGSVRQRDADYVLKLSAGAEARLVVQDARGRIVFNGPIETPEQRSLMPPAVRERVEGLERLVAQREALRQKPAEKDPASRAPVRIGTLDIAPVEVR